MCTSLIGFSSTGGRAYLTSAFIVVALSFGTCNAFDLCGGDWYFYVYMLTGLVLSSYLFIVLRSFNPVRFTRTPCI